MTGRNIEPIRDGLDVCSLPHNIEAEQGRVTRFRRDLSHSHPLVRQLFGLIWERGISLGELGRLSGVTPESIGRWSNRHNPRVPHLEAVANVLGYELCLRPKGN